MKTIFSYTLKWKPLYVIKTWINEKMREYMWDMPCEPKKKKRRIQKSIFSSIYKQQVEDFGVYAFVFEPRVIPIKSFPI